MKVEGITGHAITLEADRPLVAHEQGKQTLVHRFFANPFSTDLC
jgi:hypothetical protein